MEWGDQGPKDLFAGATNEKILLESDIVLLESWKKLGRQNNSLPVAYFAAINLPLFF